MINQVFSKWQEEVQESRREGKYTSSLKALDMANIMAEQAGARKVDVSGHVDHSIQPPSPDYLKFKQQQVQSKQVIDGEVV